MDVQQIVERLTEAGPTGKAQMALMAFFKTLPRGRRVTLADAVSIAGRMDASNRRIHFAQWMRAAETLTKKGLLGYEEVRHTPGKPSKGEPGDYYWLK